MALKKKIWPPGTKKKKQTVYFENSLFLQLTTNDNVSYCFQQYPTGFYLVSEAVRPRAPTLKICPKIVKSGLYMVQQVKIRGNSMMWRKNSPQYDLLKTITEDGADDTADDRLLIKINTKFI